MDSSVLSILMQRKKQGKKSLALLLDPDKTDLQSPQILLERLNYIAPDLVLVGGSLMLGAQLNALIHLIKTASRFKTVLFPGNALHISPEADAILFLSLISGRNPDLLIGQHVHAAPMLKRTGIEVIPTGYLLIDGGKATTANYISNTLPIPGHKPEIAACTSLAGQMLGLQCIYLDGGSGAEKPVSPKVIEAVKQEITIPLIVGGGIRTVATAEQAYLAGADMLVLGTKFEDNPDEVQHIAQLRERLGVAIN